MRPDEFVRLIDYNKHWLNVKGGKILNNYKLIIFTSVQDIVNIYKNVTGEPRAQWIRRVETIDMFPPEAPEQVCIGGKPIGYKIDKGKHPLPVGYDDNLYCTKCKKYLKYDSIHGLCFYCLHNVHTEY